MDDGYNRCYAWNFVSPGHPAGCCVSCAERTIDRTSIRAPRNKHENNDRLSYNRIDANAEVSADGVHPRLASLERTTTDSALSLP
jgi:hypothetical protein